MTRSRTKVAPNRYTLIPFPVKALKLILHDVQMQEGGKGKEKGKGKATADDLDIDEDDGVSGIIPYLHPALTIRRMMNGMMTIPSATRTQLENLTICHVYLFQDYWEYQLTGSRVAGRRWAG